MTGDEVAIFVVEQAAKMEKLVLRVTGSKIATVARSRVPVIRNERSWRERERGGCLGRGKTYARAELPRATAETVITVEKRILV